MKMVWLMLVSLLLTACGGGGGGSDGGGGDTGGGTRYSLSVAMESVNDCGIQQPYSDFGVGIYDRDGRLKRSFTANTSGEISVRIPERTSDLAIFTRDPDSPDDDVEVLVLGDYPTGDLGTLYVRISNTDGCTCETANLLVSPASGSINKVSAPYASVQSSAPTDTNTYRDAKLCRSETNVHVPMLMAHADDASGETYYRVLDRPFDQVFAGELVTNLVTDGLPGRQVPLAGTGASSTRIDYLVAGVHSLSAEGASNTFVNLVDDSAVTKLSVLVSDQQTRNGETFPVRGWKAVLPVNNSTTTLTYQKPDLEPETLADIMDQSASSYPVGSIDGSFLQAIALFSVPGGRSDTWRYLLPLDGRKPADYAIPDAFAASAGDYPADPIMQDFEVVAIDGVESVTTLYESTWGDVFIDRTATPVRPPATYTGVSVSTL